MLANLLQKNQLVVLYGENMNTFTPQAHIMQPALESDSESEEEQFVPVLGQPMMSEFALQSLNS